MDVDIYHSGNNREFTYYTENQPTLYKMAQHVVVNFNTKVIKVFSDVGHPSYEKTVNKNNGETRTDSASATPDKMKYTASFDSNENAKIYLRGIADNPLFNPSAPIDWEFNITVLPNGLATITGKHDGFPAYEIYKRLNSGTPAELYRHDPRVTGESFLSLYDPMEHDVNLVNN